MPIVMFSELLWKKERSRDAAYPGLGRASTFLASLGALRRPAVVQKRCAMRHISEQGQEEHLLFSHLWALCGDRSSPKKMRSAVYNGLMEQDQEERHRPSILSDISLHGSWRLGPRVGILSYPTRGPWRFFPCPIHRFERIPCSTKHHSRFFPEQHFAW